MSFKQKLISTVTLVFAFAALTTFVSAQDTQRLHRKIRQQTQIRERGGLAKRLRQAQIWQRRTRR